MQPEWQSADAAPTAMRCHPDHSDLDPATERRNAVRSEACPDHDRANDGGEAGPDATPVHLSRQAVASGTNPLPSEPHGSSALPRVPQRPLDRPPEPIVARMRM